MIGQTIYSRAREVLLARVFVFHYFFFFCVAQTHSAYTNMGHDFCTRFQSHRCWKTYTHLGVSKSWQDILH